jgi:hypothetical protein
LTEGQYIVPSVSQEQALKGETFPTKPQSFEDLLRSNIALKYVGPKPMGLQTLKSELHQRMGCLLAKSQAPPLTLKAVPKNIVPAGEVTLLHAATTDEAAGSLFDYRESIILTGERSTGQDTAIKKRAGLR